MKLVKLLGKVVKVAGPVAAGVSVGGPVGGGLALLGQITGSGTKVAAKAAGSQVHQVAAPVGAVAVPTLLAVVLGMLQLPGVELSNILCGSGAETGALVGILTALSHQIGHGLEKASAT